MSNHPSLCMCDDCLTAQGADPSRYPVQNLPTTPQDSRVAEARSPIGQNAKLNELIVLAMLAAAHELGQGYEQAVLEKHAYHAAKLWREHEAFLASRPSAAASGDDELVTEAMLSAGEQAFSRTETLSVRRLLQVAYPAMRRIEALTRAQPLGGDEAAIKRAEVVLARYWNGLGFDRKAIVRAMLLAALTEQKEKSQP